MPLLFFTLLLLSIGTIVFGIYKLATVDDHVNANKYALISMFSLLPFAVSLSVTFGATDSEERHPVSFQAFPTHKEIVVYVGTEKFISERHEDVVNWSTAKTGYIMIRRNIYGAETERFFNTTGTFEK